VLRSLRLELTFAFWSCCSAAGASGSSPPLESKLFAQLLGLALCCFGVSGRGNGVFEGFG
jgi:hypothetical protein